MFGKRNPLARFYIEPRILIRRLVSRANRLMAVAIDEPFVVKKDLNPFIVANPRLNLGYLLANLNSALHSHLYTEASVAAGKDDFRQTTLAELKALPIRRISFETSSAERKRLAHQGEKLYEAGLAKIDPKAVLGFAENHLTADRADVVHDLLAFLAEQMTLLNREKHSAACGFLTDLKDFHGVDAHSLKPKTKLDQFWTMEVADAFAHLKANTRLLASQGVLLKESDEEKIRSRFQKAKEKITPLESALAFTDRLIDQIVHRLYGLTEEEIRIVEEAKS